jgi:hypothetical protein
MQPDTNAFIFFGTVTNLYCSLMNGQKVKTIVFFTKLQKQAFDFK